MRKILSSWRALNITLWWSLRRDLATFSRDPERRAAARTWQTTADVKAGLRKS